MDWIMPTQQIYEGLVSPGLLLLKRVCSWVGQIERWKRVKVVKRGFLSSRSARSARRSWVLTLGYFWNLAALQPCVVAAYWRLASELVSNIGKVEAIWVWYSSPFKKTLVLLWLAVVLLVMLTWKPLWLLTSHPQASLFGGCFLFKSEPEGFLSQILCIIFSVTLQTVVLWPMA